MKKVKIRVGFYLLIYGYMSNCRSEKINNATDVYRIEFSAKNSTNITVTVDWNQTVNNTELTFNQNSSGNARIINQEPTTENPNMDLYNIKTDRANTRGNKTDQVNTENGPFMKTTNETVELEQHYQTTESMKKTAHDLNFLHTATATDFNIFNTTSNGDLQNRSDNDTQEMNRPNHEELMREINQLFKDYSSTFAPLEDIGLSIELRFDQLQEIDERRQIMIANFRLQLRYRDKRIRWNHLGEKYTSGIPFVLVPESLLWRPNMYLVNGVEKMVDTTRFVNARIYSNGDIELKYYLITHTSCNLQVDLFPFDVQLCNISFDVISYWRDELLIQSATGFLNPNIEKVTCLLSMTVFMIVLQDTLSPDEKDLPLLGKYLGFMTLNITLATASSAVVIYIFTKSEQNTKPTKCFYPLVVLAFPIIYCKAFRRGRMKNIGRRRQQINGTYELHTVSSNSTTNLEGVGNTCRPNEETNDSKEGNLYQCEAGNKRNDEKYTWNTVANACNRIFAVCNVTIFLAYSLYFYQLEY